MKTVEVLSIGDELLRGVVADTNSGWIASRVAARGAALRRVTTLPDTPDIVAGVIREAFGRGTDLIVTHGGLGPTDDDRTRDAVALALDAPCETNAAALDIVRRRYEELAVDGRVQSAALNAPRLKMTRLPRGAIALDNHIGAAPGVLMRRDEQAIVCLPGVPPELHWIWEQTLVPHLDEILGPGGWAEITLVLSETDESRIAELLEALAARHPDVYVKSRAKGFEVEDRIRVTLTAAGGDDVEARTRVEAALAELRRDLDEAGVSVASRPAD
jgi:molybdenum cofactor synthesis domain-containing protein